MHPAEVTAVRQLCAEIASSTRLAKELLDRHLLSSSGHVPTCLNILGNRKCSQRCQGVRDARHQIETAEVNGQRIQEIAK